MKPEYKYMEVDTAIHIPEGHRLSIHGMAGLMNMNDKCIWNVGHNLFAIVDDDTMTYLQNTQDSHVMVGVEYNEVMYDYNEPEDDKVNIVFEPTDLWDEYSDWVEEAI